MLFNYAIKSAGFYELRFSLLESARKRKGKEEVTKRVRAKKQENECDEEGNLIVDEQKRTAFTTDQGALRKIRKRVDSSSMARRYLSE